MFFARAAAITIAGVSMAASDDELIARAVGGDEAALTALLRIHGPRVRTGLAGRIPPHLQAVLSEDDVMQVTYMDAFLGIPRFQPQDSGSFPAWLARIAENNLLTAIKMLEARKRPDPRRQVQSPGGDDSYVALLDRLQGTGSAPSRSAARHEARTILEKAVSQLPEAHQKVVRMYDLEGRSAAELAATLRRSEGAVYMLRTRAHERLREMLGSGSQFFSTLS